MPALYHLIDNNSGRVCEVRMRISGSNSRLQIQRTPIRNHKYWTTFSAKVAETEEQFMHFNPTTHHLISVIC